MSDQELLREVQARTAEKVRLLARIAMLDVEAGVFADELCGRSGRRGTVIRLVR